MPKIHYNKLESLGDETACGLDIGFGVDKGGYFETDLEYTLNPEAVTCKNCKRTKIYKDEQPKE